MILGLCGVLVITTSLLPSSCCAAGSDGEDTVCRCCGGQNLAVVDTLEMLVRGHDLERDDFGTPTFGVRMNGRVVAVWPRHMEPGRVLRPMWSRVRIPLSEFGYGSSGTASVSLPCHASVFKQSLDTVDGAAPSQITSISFVAERDWERIYVEGVKLVSSVSRRLQPV